VKGSVSCMCGSLFSCGTQEFVAHKEVFAPRELALASFCSDWFEGRRNGVGLHYCHAVDCTENPIYVFPEIKLCGLITNSYIPTFMYL
jgi:hypothetical protein